VRRRIQGIPSDDFDEDKYYETLESNELGKVIIYVPSCGSTMDISKRYHLLRISNNKDL
jgi:hypothetical protein